MIERGVGGSIIKYLLTRRRAPRAHVSAYGAAKAGVINLTQTMASSLGPHGIRRTSLPGDTVTAAVGAAAQSRSMQAVANANPLGRLGEPDDHAGAILFLASDLSRYVNDSSSAWTALLRRGRRRAPQPARRRGHPG